MRSLCLFLILISSAFFISCEKDVDELQSTKKIDTSREYLDNEFENQVRDSVWYYYKVLSLWETSISPDHSMLNFLDSTNYLRDNYTKYFQTGNQVLEFLMDLTKPFDKRYYSRFSKLSPADKNYDWYSFIDRGGFVSGAIQKAEISGFGMSLLYLQTDNTVDNADLYVKMVENNSSAFLNGIKRGYRVISINGDAAIDYNTQNEQNYSKINSYLRSSSMTIKYINSEGEIFEKVLINTSNSNVDPVLNAKVIDWEGKKVGYLNFNNFVSLGAYIRIDGVYTTMKERFTTIFSNFEASGISDLVIDMRYNGGGSVSTAEFLADLIVPAAADKQLMYTYGVNKIVEDWGWKNEGETFAPIYYSKKGNLNISKVYFLVTNETASASELLINSLKPYMSTYIIGILSNDEKNNIVAENTYGKPVGFFGLPIVTNSTELYVTSFKMYNKNGEGDYFEGLIPDNNVWEFSQFHDFGDSRETMLAAALNHIKTGNFIVPTSRMGVASKSGVKANISIPKKSIENKQAINGMFKFLK